MGLANSFPDFERFCWRCRFTFACGSKNRRCSRKLKDQGKSSASPLKDSLGNRKNWGLILLALFGATAGQAVVWYTGQFYALFFLQTSLKVDYATAYIIVAVALALGTPFFIVFGSLSDRIGRKKIMMSGYLIAAITYVPIYMAMNASQRRMWSC